MPKYDPIWPKIGISDHCLLIWCPVGGLAGGCGARAVSRKTPIYFIKYSEKKKVMTDRQIDRQKDRISYLRLDPFCGRGRRKSALQICEVDNVGHDLMF